MLADLLTKSMKPDRLLEALESGILDLRPTSDSLMIKAKNQQYRKKKKGEKQAHKDHLHEAKKQALDDGRQDGWIAQHIAEMNANPDIIDAVFNDWED